MELLHALGELFDEYVERLRAYFQPSQPSRSRLHRVRWFFVTKDENWGKLVGAHPELHDLASPEIYDCVLDPNGDAVFMPTPNGGVTALVAMRKEFVEELLGAWSLYQKVVEASNAADEDEGPEVDDELRDKGDEAGDFIDEWIAGLIEQIEQANEERDRWESA